MKIVTGHKGGFEIRTEITGHAVHSCDPRKGVNAITLAMKFIAKIDEIAASWSLLPVTLGISAKLVSQPCCSALAASIERTNRISI